MELNHNDRDQKKELGRVLELFYIFSLGPTFFLQDCQSQHCFLTEWKNTGTRVAFIIEKTF